MIKSGSPRLKITILVSSTAAAVLAGAWLFSDSGVINTQDRESESVFEHRMVNDMLCVTFNENVTDSEARRIAGESGYEVAGSCFTDVILKAELEEGWTEETIDAIESLPGVVRTKVIGWKMASDESRKDDAPVYGLCYVKSRHRELTFVYFRNGTTRNEIRSLCERLGDLKVLEITNSPNDLFISCPREKMREAVQMFEENSEVKYVAYLSELYSR